MTYRLLVNSDDPPAAALIVTHLVNASKKVKVEIAWQKDFQQDVNVQLLDEQNKVIGDNSNEINRYFARVVNPDLYGNNACEKTEVDHWLSYATVHLGNNISNSTLSYLDDVLLANTWLVAKKLTLADVHVFSALLHQDFIEKYGKQFINISRWYKQMLSLPAVLQVLPLMKKNKTAIAKNDKPEKSNNSKQSSTRKQEGKFIDLPGAEMGKVVVRFPPEASGYLHIGHAKAALLNQYYAQAFEGQLIMRFDDTNPAKEDVEFEQAILHDLKLLQIKPDKFTHSSDYFDLMLEYCTQLIKAGKAFVDDTPAAVMKEQRDQKVKSEKRDNSVEENLKLWEEMQKGTSKGQECCVRAKIDYESANGCLRDPTIYRCKPEPHPRTGTKYKVYPTYDFACPIVDVVENVTHTLRTTEYHDRDAQFYWIIDALGLRRPYIWEYSRLNMTNTVLSKRKLTWFVNEGLVDGWDDPRFPTVRGILRRGMTVEGLKQFIIAQGSSRSVVFMEWDKIWAFNKKIIDPVAIRYTALELGKTVPVTIVDAKEEFVTVQNHPKDATIGTKEVLRSSLVYIEKVDAEQLTEGSNATFVNWGNILIQKIEKQNGNVTKIIAKTNLENKDFKNTLKLTWLGVPASKINDSTTEQGMIPCFAVDFDHIISKPVLGKDDDFKDFVTKNTRTETQMLGEPELKRVKKGEIIQLQRKGYYICDVPYAPASPFSSREQPLILFNIPDGHTTPQKAAVTTTAATTPVKSVSKSDSKSNNADEINTKIVAQGDKIRRLKTEKAEKSVIDTEVKLLLSLKAEYKECTGTEWKPGMAPKSGPQTTNASNNNSQLANEISLQEAKIQELQKKLNEETARLLNLKNSLKDSTKSVKTEVVQKTSASADDVSSKIQQQGDKVRQLKGAKADKNVIDQEVKVLLSLKSEYKSLTGQDWKPGVSPKQADVPKKATVDSEGLSASIQAQGDKVRQLKTAKADKSIIDQEVKILLSLKADYKTATGQDWKPDSAKPPVTKLVVAEDSSTKAAGEIANEIQKQGDKVRALKESKAQKNIIDQEVKILLSLKADYKTATGQDWKPDSAKTPATKPVVAEDSSTKAAGEIANEIQKQGDKVRALKESKAQKNIIDQEVKILLSLKNDYKNTTGQEWKPAKADAAPKKKKKEETPKAEKQSKEVVKSEAPKDTDTAKTGTRLGLEAKKEENFFEWYSQIITKSGMIEYYDVSGCYILRPWSFAIWKSIKEFIEKEITKLGVQECYFPIFVTRAVLEKEKAHIADFAPEVAWVTKCGDSDLAEPIAIRPTSETVMYPAYAKWLRSDTELPIRLNQWNNVVRWEFKDPKPFLRTREFLWQEGHTAFATKAEADEEVLIILDMYAKVYEDLLAVPVVKGRKTEKEKFAGGDYTTTVEAFISTSGRAIQGATSHHLGQNFSKMFNIQVEGVAGTDEKTYVYQNSWGMTTRTVGVMIMVHGDDKGLVLPPNVACIQAIIVPCGLTANTSQEQRTTLFAECNKLLTELRTDSSLRVDADYRSNRTPGWKFNHWELKGVPVRVELGPKDLEKNQVTFVRRDNSQRIAVKRNEAVTALRALLNEIHTSMLTKARNNLTEHIKQVDKWEAFCTELNKKNLLLSPFCGEPSCEDNIKGDSAREDAGEELGTLSMGAKSLCIPFEQPQHKVPLNQQKCIHPSCQNTPKFYTLFGRSY